MENRTDNRAMECRKCKKIKYLAGFVKNNRVSLGYDRECKECFNSRLRAYNYGGEIEWVYI